jgi:sugar phosphate isomerase/epimerase
MPPKIALQLYTLRDAFAQDFTGTLERIAAIGYTNVESAFFPEGISVQEAARRIRQAGLTVMAAHCELPLDEQTIPVLEQVATLGCTRMIWHGWPQDPDYGSVDGIKRLAELYNLANAVATTHNLQFGLHNHWWEMEPVEDQYPYQILLQELDPTIFFEVDTYWTKTAGRDPVQIVTEMGERAPLLHIKDGPAVKDQPMVAAGDGTMDIPAIAQAANGHAEWLIVELDACATDMFTAVERSFRYLVNRGIAQA